MSADAAASTGVRAVVEVLAKALADAPDQVRVTETQHQKVTLIELFVSPRDFAKVLGRSGRTAAALRTLGGDRGGEGRQTGNAGDPGGPVKLQDCGIAGLQEGGRTDGALILSFLQSCNSEILQCPRSGKRWLLSAASREPMGFAAR